MSEFAENFGKGVIKMTLSDGGLLDNLNRGPDRIHKELVTLTEFYAPQIENWMKNNAPWTDRTGNARNGLAARPYSDDSSVGIVLFHQVPYGIWLEVRNSGRYAIIVPGLEEWGQRVMAGAKNMMERI